MGRIVTDSGTGTPRGIPVPPRISLPPGTTQADIIPGVVQGTTYVVPGFSTDASGNLVTTSNVGDVQRAASAAASAAVADVDWADVYFGSYGLPQDLKNQIIELGKKYGTTNPSVFFQAAQNLIRGSDWFKTTFPGFDAGVRAGLFTDETGYRGYVNGLNNVYQQYLGRQVSSDETAAALGRGATPDLISRQFQGDAIANVNAGQWQYVSGAFDEAGPLTAAERTALGREQAGIDTPLGQMVSKRVQQAMARAQALFGGTLATPSVSIASGRLAAPSLGSTSNTPDIAA